MPTSQIIVTQVHSALVLSVAYPRGRKASVWSHSPLTPTMLLNLSPFMAGGAGPLLLRRPPVSVEAEAGSELPFPSDKVQSCGAAATSCRYAQILVLSNSPKSLALARKEILNLRWNDRLHVSGMWSWRLQVASSVSSFFPDQRCWTVSEDVVCLKARTPVLFKRELYVLGFDKCLFVVCGSQGQKWVSLWTSWWDDTHSWPQPKPRSWMVAWAI